jgi:hypothetical protein
MSYAWEYAALSLILWAPTLLLGLFLFVWQPNPASVILSIEIVAVGQYLWGRWLHAWGPEEKPKPSEWSEAT